jgi:hypothetical protein
MRIGLPYPSKGGVEDASYSPDWRTRPLVCLVVTNTDVSN